MTEPRISLSALHALPAAGFDALLAPLFEHAPWVTQGLAGARPFGSLSALHAAAVARMHAAPEAARLDLLRGHPPLSPAALRGGVTAESLAEQRAAQLDAIGEEAAARLDAGNAAFRARFGFPFILAVRYAGLQTILGALERRLGADPAAEMAEALQEVEAISWMRLLDRVEPARTGGISIQVQDTERSRPAAGLLGELWHVPPAAAPACAAHLTTDADGRAGTTPDDGVLQAGPHELRLDTASYLARTGVPTPHRAALPTLVVRFGVANPEEHHHLSVLLSQGGYTACFGR